MILVLKSRATAAQIRQMLQEHGNFIKAAVDIERETLAGGGEFHADCAQALIEAGSRKQDIWGANWYPAGGLIQFTALINIRPDANAGMDIHDAGICRKVEVIVTQLLQAEHEP